MINNGDIICFLGDSLTASGYMVAEVYQEVGYKKRIKCFNCGVAGGRAAYAKEYLHSYCLSKNPSKVIIMFGMNDIGFPLYSKDCSDPDVEEKKARAIEIHKESYRKIVLDCLDFGAEPILCTPLPYDEFDSEKEGENLHCQAALDLCSLFVTELAAELGLKLIDIRGRMLPLIKENPALMTQDRMHPTVVGYHAMTQVLLNELGEIERPSYGTPFVFEQWNKDRYAVERKLKLIEFIDLVALYEEAKEHKWGTTEKKREALIRYGKEPNKAGYFPMCYKFYSEHAEEREALLGEVVKLTKFTSPGG